MYTGVSAYCTRLSLSCGCDAKSSLVSHKKNRLCVKNDKNGSATVGAGPVELCISYGLRRKSLLLLSVTRSFHYVFRSYFRVLNVRFSHGGSFTRLPGPFTVYPVVIFTKGDIQSFDPFFYACSACCHRRCRVFVCSINCK